MGLVERARRRTGLRGGVVVIYLASRSPRRKALLRAAGLRYQYVRSDYVERMDAARRPSALVRRHALGKALGSLPSVRGSGVILAADTIVYHRGRILGKPVSFRGAERMLGALQGRWHRVYTGVCLLEVRQGRPKRRVLWVETTRVRIRRMTRHDIRAYFRKVDPLDKAGAYAIQSRAVKVVERHEGCYDNAVGLPASAIRQIKKFQKNIDK